MLLPKRSDYSAAEGARLVAVHDLHGQAGRGADVNLAVALHGVLVQVVADVRADVLGVCRGPRPTHEDLHAGRATVCMQGRRVEG